MINKRSGFGLVEVMVVIGLISIVSAIIFGLMTNVFKGFSSAQKSAERTDLIGEISQALAKKQTCPEALGAGTLVFPAMWSSSSPVQIDKIEVAGRTLAETGKTKNGLGVERMRLELVSGPYPVRYNIAPAGALAETRSFKRYFSKLVVEPIKAGGAQSNTGGEKLRNSEFKLAILVNDNNRLHDCFGGIDEGDLVKLCEKAFDGDYDQALLPWCTPLQISIGISRSSLTPQYPRFAVLEKQNLSSPQQDLTMGLIGGADTTSNGPGLWFASRPSVTLAPTSNAAYLAFVNRANAYRVGTQPGDFIISNRTANGDIEVGTTDVHLKQHQGDRAISVDRPVEINAGEGTVTIHSTDGQGRAVVAGVSDAGFTYSAIYFNPNNLADVKLNSWALTHKGPSSGVHNSFLIARWFGNAMQPGFIITSNYRVGIGTINPTEKFQVEGNAVVAGTLRGTTTATLMGHMSVGGNVLASSDEALKENIKPLGDILESLLNWNPVTYEWKKGEGPREVGFIAQQLEKVLPEVVRNSYDGIKHLAYFAMVAPMSRALQQIIRQFEDVVTLSDQELSKINRLQTQLKVLQNRQAGLEKRNVMLREKLSTLRRDLASTDSAHGQK